MQLFTLFGFYAWKHLPAALMPLASNASSLKTSHDRGSLSQLIGAKRVPPLHQQLGHHALLEARRWD